MSNSNSWPIEWGELFFTTTPLAPIHTVALNQGVALFAADSMGRIYTMSASENDLTGWYSISEGSITPGGPVSGFGLA